MSFPWVSREQYEYVQQQLVKVDAERQRLLDRLLGDPADRLRVAQARAVEHTEVEIEPEPVGQGVPVSFSTPFDRVEKRMGDALLGGKIPNKFRARAN